MINDHSLECQFIIVDVTSFIAYKRFHFANSTSIAFFSVLARLTKFIGVVIVCYGHG